MSLLLTCRFLAFLPDPRGRLTDITIGALDRVSGIGLTPLRRAPYLLAAESGASDRTEESHRLLLLDTFPGALASGRPLTQRLSGASWTDLHAAAADEVQFYNLVEATPEELRLESDVLGLKPVYHAELPGGRLLASRIADMGALFPDLLATPDQLGVAQFLYMGKPLDDRTLHENVRLALTGSCFHWRRPGPVQITRERRPEYPPANAAVGIGEATALLKQELTGCLERRSRHARTPFLLALSGGFDSRLTAAIAKEADLKVELYTYGRSYHQETRAARAVARELGFPHHVLRYPIDNLTARMPMHLAVVEGQADPQQVQIANLLDIPSSEGQGLLHGYLGDGVCGQPLGWLQPDELADLDLMTRGLARYVASPAIRRFVAGLNLQKSEADFLASLRDSLCSKGQPYQALMLWDWENRKRRMVGQQLPMLGTRLDVIAPFYNIGVLNTCAALPRIALEDRNIVRFLLRRYFPALARIPHTDERDPIIPNLRHQLPFTLRRAPRKAASIALGSDRLLRLEERYFAWREPDIWRLSFGAATPGQRSRMVARIKELAPDLERRFAVRPPDDLYAATFGAPFKGDRWGHLHAVRRLWALAEYAHHLGRNAVATPAGGLMGQAHLRMSPAIAQNARS